jgi:nucleotide-binding universal stress UspA family protein
MSYQDILVYVGRSGSDEPIEVAARLAKSHRAYLTGLLALHGVAMLRSVSRAGSALVTDFAKDEYASAKIAEKRFRGIAARARVSHEWLLAEGDRLELLSMFGRLQDLVVIGQTPPEDPDLGRNVVDAAVLMHGPATLVVPHTGTFPAVGRQILIAWNGSQEAAAAVRAARPLVSAADSVTVLVGRSRESFSSITRLPRAATPPLDLAAYLRRRANRLDIHGFDVSDADAGPAILDRASQVGADLVVMGAYGRPWLRQWILGGATRHVLQSATVPVLMAR